ncbi:tRNA endonuclease ANKZF1 isoform X2 [Neopsephotus bourkii]|uniref:tRNA endonuclease ANKZF1 isoform X2 n=1 Tax=Neopsephotus bourkii TaxID=309878 RepID=UPI002AA5BE45|nr:tRNA endonuclease ANKZF1 isoform X2 [Neopsephotus bourkii]
MGWSLSWGTPRGNKANPCVLAKVSLYQGGTEEPVELAASLQSLHASTCWVVLMMGGGHFAGAVFRGPQVQEHKTFHRYTVRARRGTAQSLRDAHTPGSAPRSAGASLRRYNEAALLKDIQDLLLAWAQHLNEAQRIFLRAPRHNRALLFSGRNPPLTLGDPRIFHIPLSTRRPTLREVLRVHSVLASLQVYGKDTPLEDITGSPRKGWQKRRHKAEVDPPQEDMSAPVLQPPSAPEEEAEEEEESPAGELETVEVTLGTLDLQEFKVMPKRNCKKRKKRDKKVEKGPCAEEMGCHGTQCRQPGLELMTERQGEAEPLPWGNGGDPQTQFRDALFTACKTGDVGMLRHLLGVPEHGALSGASKDGEDTQPLDMPRSLLSQPMDEHGCTLLHVAARAGRAEAVCLLLEAGADPAIRDDQERTPYCVSADRLTRNTFRKFMVDHPDKYDYSRAKVPGPLTQEMEAKKLEKKRAQKAQRKQREQAQREERQRQEQEQAEKQRFAALSDREKRALAAERRLAVQLQDTGTTLANISDPFTQSHLCSVLQPLLALWRVPAGPDPFPLPRLLLLLHSLPANTPPGPGCPHIRLGAAATCQGPVGWRHLELAEQCWSKGLSWPRHTGATGKALGMSVTVGMLQLSSSHGLL